MSVFQAFMTGARAGQEDWQRKERQQIGGLMASGDYQGAAQRALGGGMFDLAGMAQGQQTAQETQERQRKAGGLYGKDPALAIQYARGEGDFELAGQLDEMFANSTKEQRETAARNFETLAGVAAPFRQLPYEQRKPAILQQAPMLMQLGMTMEQIEAFDPTDANIDAIVGTAMGAKDYLALIDRREREVFDRGLEERRVAVTERREGRVAGNQAARSGGGRSSGGGGGARPAAAPTRSASSTLPPGFRIRR